MAPEVKSLRTFCFGILHAIGRFDLADLTDEEKLDCAEEKAWFSLGEVVMAGMLAATIATPAGLLCATRTDPALAFIGAAVLFLPLFVFLPKLIRYAMKADTEAVLTAFGKNEQMKKVFWSIFLAMAGLVLAQVADPALAREILGLVTGT